MSSDSSRCFLEILIPTYNRCKKLNKLLSILEKEVESIPRHIKVRITVSDNHSSDGTQDMLKQHSFRDNIIARTNSENVGPLRNIWGLYETVRADYVWVISDDDIPKPGSLKKIIDILIEYKPTVLTFEFEQPPGNASKRHGDKTGVEELSDLSVAIPHILILGKLTKQIFSVNQVQTAMKNMMFSKDTGYGWLLVILEIIKLAHQKKIVIFHDFLAGCDEDYAQVTDGLNPQYWEDYLLLMDHEIVKVHCSEYARRYRNGHRIYMVKMIYSVMSGVIKCSAKRIFGEKGRTLPFDSTYFRNPFVALQWVSLRIGLPATPIICQLTDYLGKAKTNLLSILNKYNVRFVAWLIVLN